MAGLFGPVGMNPMQQGTFAPTMQTTPEQPMRKGGLFGSGIKWNDVAGIIGDALLSANGSQPVYTPLVMQQRQQQNALARMQAQRQAELQDQMALYDYKRANPEPANDSFTRALAAAGIQPGTPDYIKLARKRAEMLTNPVQLVPDGYGGVQPYRPYGEEEAPPTAPVGKLMPYNGGPTPPASGSFR